MTTFVRVSAGFALGWIIYMVAMVLTVYDGGLSLLFQPIMAAICSAVFVAAAFVAGLPLRLRKVRELWSRFGWWPLLFAASSIGVMIFHRQLGLEAELVHPETNDKFHTMTPAVALLCYFTSIFFVVNLPYQNQPNKAPEPTPMAVTPPAAQEPRQP